jgi:diguanylate cyclase (GGDEF)-like protein
VSLFFMLCTVAYIDYKLTALLAAELAVSNVVSFIILGNEMLPQPGDDFHVLLGIQLLVMALFYGLCVISVYMLSTALVSGFDNKLSTMLEELENTEESANRDALTGLFNRRYANLLFASLYDEREGDRYCVALLDIDDFKLINDTYGHPCGDQVLAALAAFVRGSLRKSDKVFRWGGEEFLILLQGADLPAARAILEKLCTGLAEMIIETREAPIRITATIGIAELDAGDVAAGIKACDDRLYEGKRSGKNMVVAEQMQVKEA